MNDDLSRIYNLREQLHVMKLHRDGWRALSVLLGMALLIAAVGEHMGIWADRVLP